MQTTPSLMRTIGQTERTLQAVLHQKLSGVGLTFPQWVILTALSGGQEVSSDDLVARAAGDRIAGRQEAHQGIAELTDRGLLEATDRRHSLSAAGKEFITPLRQDVERTVAQLLEGISATDMDATVRTLDAIKMRAAERLRASG